MARRRETSSEEPETRRPAAPTPESRENQLISLAVDLAEKQLREGTASSQVISHYLKMGSPRERKEREKLDREVALLGAKQEQIESAQRVEVLYAEALNAMRAYSGQPPISEDEYED